MSEREKFGERAPEVRAHAWLRLLAAGYGTVMADINPIHLQKALKGVDYPASKSDLLTTARQNEADDDVIGFLDGLPDREYDGPNGVSKEISA